MESSGAMDPSTSNGDLMVVLQTENGEQIALPMSALPNDFVPGDSGQIIMVESGLDEQQQEIVVESSDLSGHHQTGSNDLVSLQHVDPNPHISTLDFMPESNEEVLNSNNVDAPDHTELLATNIPTTSYADKTPGPRTYSKNNVVKSYAPTCGPARIYQQCQPLPVQQQQHHHQHQQQQQPNNHQLPSKDFQTSNNEIMSSDNAVENEQQHLSDNSVLSSEVVVPLEQAEEKPVVVPRCKQKRKEPLLLRPINEEDDLKLEYIVVKEPSPPVQEPEVKRRRKDHRSKRNRTKQQDKQQPQQAQQAAHLQQQPQQQQEQSPTQQSPPESENQQRKLPKHPITPKKENPQPSKQQSKQYCQQQQQPQTERRTRLSNACRVATSKNYKCNDCDFSTDRINNIVLHVKEQCPYLKRKEGD